MFQRFFYGRNGPDHLSFAALIAACILSFIPYGVYASVVLLAYAIFRIVSKNVNKRRAENYKFVMFWNRVKSGVTGFFTGLKQSRTHKVFSCPQCGQKLRVPRGKGKINITCSKCGHKFVKNT